MKRLTVRVVLGAILVGAVVAAVAVLVPQLPGCKEHRAAYFTNVTLPPLGAIPVTETLYPSRGVQCLRLLGLSHQPVGGTNVVVTDRTLTDPRMFAADDEEFDILSLQLPEHMIGKRMSLPSPDVSIRYSTGKLWGAHRCIGRIASEAQGIVSTHRVGEDLLVSLDLEVSLYESGRDAAPIPIRLKREIQAEKGHIGDRPDVFDEMLQQTEHLDAPLRSGE